jgi:hypothetical protein
MQRWMCHGHDFAGLGLSLWPYSRGEVIAPGLAIAHHFPASVRENARRSPWQLAGSKRLLVAVTLHGLPARSDCAMRNLPWAVCLRALSVAYFPSEPATVIAMHLESDRAQWIVASANSFPF